MIAPPIRPNPSLASLPEEVRFNILLFLGNDSMRSLERAVKLRNKAKEDFLRAHNINKRLTKIHSKYLLKFLDHGDVEESLVLERQMEKSRRRDLLTRLMSLDTDTLDGLFLLFPRLLFFESCRLHAQSIPDSLFSESFE